MADDVEDQRPTDTEAPEPSASNARRPQDIRSVARDQDLQDQGAQDIAADDAGATAAAAKAAGEHGGD